MNESLSTCRAKDRLRSIGSRRGNEANCKLWSTLSCTLYTSTSSSTSPNRLYSADCHYYYKYNYYYFIFIATICWLSRRQHLFVCSNLAFKTPKQPLNLMFIARKTKLWHGPFRRRFDFYHTTHSLPLTAFIWLLFPMDPSLNRNCTRVSAHESREAVNERA